MNHILYHSPCPDGTAAALAAYLAFGSSATYHPTNYSNPKPAIPDGADVYFVDFSWPRADLEALAARSKSVTVLDHHKTAEADLAGFPGATFDMSKSGAVMAWEYFRPNEAAPRMFELIQDRDLWRWEFGDETRRFAAYLQTVESSIPSYHGVLCGDMMSMLEAGRILLTAQDQNVNRLCGNAYWVEMGGHRFIAANAPILQSEVGNALLGKFPEAPFAAAFAQVDGAQRWSLRGRGDFDVAEVAAKFGGGGHKSAAGFVLHAG